MNPKKASPFSRGWIPAAACVATRAWNVIPNPLDSLL
jgi:hypothetical protein